MSKIAVTIDGRAFEVDIKQMLQPDGTIRLRVADAEIVVRVAYGDLIQEDSIWMIINDRPYEIVFDRELHWIKTGQGVHQIEVRDLDTAVSRPRSGDGRIKAPIPGLITQVLVQPGQRVEIGQPLMVLDAMKMQNELRAPCAGVVSAIHVTKGQGVARGQVLAEIAQNPAH